MAKYLIIDTEKVKSNLLQASSTITTIPTGAILSPEETEAVFKKVYEDGHAQGWYDCCGNKVDDRDKHRDEYLKTL